MPAQMMYQHALDRIKGWPTNPTVDKAAPFAASELAILDPIPAGRVVHLNASGEFELGASGHQMPMYLMQPSDAFDVANDGGNNWEAIAPAGANSALVAVGALELETTEFEDGAAFAVNALLTSPTTGELTTGKTNAGMLTDNLDGFDYAAGSGAVEQYADHVCGVVSQGVHANAHGVDVIRFWPYFLPASA